MLNFSYFLSAVAAETAPWWGVPVVAGTFLLVGGLLGGAISFFSTWKADQRRAKREDRQRWDREILDRAGRVVIATDEVYEANYELQRELIRHAEAGGPIPATLDAAMVRAKVTVNEFAAARTALIMIAPDLVTRASHALGSTLVATQADVSRTTLPSIAVESEKMTQFLTAVRDATGISEIVDLKR
jgi:hypothetical protein